MRYRATDPGPKLSIGVDSEWKAIALPIFEIFGNSVYVVIELCRILVAQAPGFFNNRITPHRGYPL